MTLPLSLRHMEVLRAVLQGGSISAGARELAISQPAVSRMVRGAEDAVGVKLFSRTPGGGVMATPELLALGREIERVFVNVEGARSLGRILRHGAGRVVRVALTPALAPALLPSAAAALRRRFPEARLAIKVREPAPIEDAVIRRDFDIGLVYTVRRTDELHVEPLCRAPLVCILHGGDRLTRLPRIAAADLADVPLISFSSRAAAGVLLDRHFAAAGITRQVAIETGNSHLAAPLVRAGLGVAIVDPFLIGTPSLTDLVVRPFVPEVTIVPHLLHARDHALSRPEVMLVETLRDVAEAWVRSASDSWRT